MPYTVKTLRVLILEDSEMGSHEIINELKNISTPITFKFVSTLQELSTELKGRPWNFVISGHRGEAFSISDALEMVRAYSQSLPFILVTDKIGEEVVADLLKSGVEDIVLRSRMERLSPVIKRVIRESEAKRRELLARKMADEALGAKEQMLAVVSHDIRNPLSAIHMGAQMLLRATEQTVKSVFSEEVKLQANRIIKTTERMKSLISDLLDRNKSANGLSQLEKKTVSLPHLLQEVLDATRDQVLERKILCKTFFPDSLDVSIDRNRMYQVFSNLISNAIKFSPDGGVILLALEEENQEIIFRIQDSGPGLEDQELHRVFDKYWTGSSTNCGGTGLGLFICKTIIEAHGGQIFAENNGEGACFSFTLPKKKIDYQSASFSFCQKKGDSRKKIYIVDDDEDLREVMSWALTKEGFSIHSFHSPKEALDCLNSGDYLPDLILVDYHMDEMKGSEFVQKKNLIVSAKECPVIMVSGSPEEAREKIPSYLYKEIVPKPLDLDGLIGAIQGVLQ